VEGATPALSIARSKPQWRIMLDALECLIRESPDAEKKKITEIVKRVGRSRGDLATIDR
jgi:hypothetical protein